MGSRAASAPAVSGFPPPAGLWADLNHAVVTLTLQQQLIDELQVELTLTRLERDEARRIYRLLVEVKAGVDGLALRVVA